MKKLFCSIISSIFLVGCTNSDEPDVQIPQKDSESDLNFSKMRTLEEVLEIADNASNMITPSGDENGLSRGYGRVIDYQTPIYNIGPKNSRSNDNNTLMYVVNYTDNNGFALVSAPRDAPELLAVTEHGHYNPSEPIELEGFNLWMDETIEMLEAITNDENIPDITSPVSLDTIIKTVRDTIWYREVAPKVRVAWGQGKDNIIQDACEGLECPNGISGCANTAVAMVMSYLERPSSIKLTYLPEKPILSLNWKELKKYLSYDDTQLCVFPESDYPIRTSLASLLREIGEQANSDYRSTATGTYPSVTPSLLRQFSLSSASDWTYGGGVASYEVIFNTPGAILLVRGNSSRGGHQWICDGVQNYVIENKLYKSGNGGITWKYSSSSYSPEYYYIHYNWGWHGKCNGHYYHTDTWSRKNGEEYIEFNSNRQFITIMR